MNYVFETVKCGQVELNHDINLLLNSNDDVKKGCFILIRLEAITIIDNI